MIVSRPYFQTGNKQKPIPTTNANRPMPASRLLICRKVAVGRENSRNELVLLINPARKFPSRIPGIKLTRPNKAHSIAYIPTIQRRDAPRLRNTAISLRWERTNRFEINARKNSTRPKTGMLKANREPERLRTDCWYWRMAGAGEVSKSVLGSMALTRFSSTSMRVNNRLT